MPLAQTIDGTVTWNYAGPYTGLVGSVGGGVEQLVIIDAIDRI
jgi:hypothetical protein